jgi:hypothetical protein
MKRDAPAAHVRLLETMPKDRISTHHKRERVASQGYRANVSKELVREYRRLKAQGCTQIEIRRILRAGSELMKRLIAAAA